MSKAFDRMEWSFIKFFLQRLGFTETWCQLVDQCISTAAISILLNGAPIETMVPTRGLRQGDSLSPYIFILCMESFSRMIQSEVEKKNICPIYPARNGPPVSHMFFADDCILFYTAKRSSIDNLQKVIYNFCKVSGQMVNISKSSLHFSKRLSEESKEYVCNTMGMNIMPLDEKYLGINLFIGRKKTKCFSSIQEKMQKIIQQWQAGMVNQPGRSTQIQSVTNLMAQFQMGCFILPQQTINQLKATQRRYWWNKNNGKGIYFISSSDVSIPKRWGGLGFKNLKYFNEALITKLAWRLVQEKGKNWTLILEARYFKQENILQNDLTDKDTEIWKIITKGIEWLRKFHIWLIGDGKTVYAFRDNWIQGYSAQQLQENFGENEVIPYHMKVADFIDNNTRGWNMNLLQIYFTQDQIE